jgi:hypothetical protein
MQSHYINKKVSKMKKLFILLIWSLTSFVYCGRNNPKYFFNEVEGYVRISKETSGFLVDKMKFPIKNQSSDNYDYIFQKFPIDTLFEYPYIRIQINENSRLTKSELEELGKKFYKNDPNTHYLWQENRSQLNVIIPTNLGTINV